MFLACDFVSSLLPLLRDALQSSYLNPRECEMLSTYMASTLAKVVYHFRPPLYNNVLPSYSSGYSLDMHSDIQLAKLRSLKNEYVILVHTLVTRSSTLPLAALRRHIDDALTDFLCMPLSQSLSSCIIK